MDIIYFLLALCATTIGALSGIGGGVIIKPGLDFMGTLSVSAGSFLSTCTVLAMTTSSLIKNRNSDVKLNLNISLFLGTGAVLGGFIGKRLFTIIEANGWNVGLYQTLVLQAVIVVIVIYLFNKSKIKSFHFENRLFTFGLGLFLGIRASFVGIGGGPINVAILYFFYSMDGKEAARNSLFVIFLSQITSVLTTVVNGTIPEFNYWLLVLMCSGGVAGAILGSKISKKIDSKTVEKIFTAVLIALIVLNSYNIYTFAIK